MASDPYVFGWSGARGEDAVLGAIEFDESFDTLRTVSRGPQGRTEVVGYKGGTYLRKRIPSKLADRDVWKAVATLGPQRSYALPRIMSIYELPDELVVVMEYVQGLTVEQIVSTYGALPPRAAAQIITGVCAGLTDLHAARPWPVLHRDVTPQNVIVSPLGDARLTGELADECPRLAFANASGRFDPNRIDRVVLCDMGIARFCRNAASPGGDQEGAFDTSHDTRVLGTRGYAAPEQFGFARTDERSDVYGAGALLGYMLSGADPDAYGYAERLADASQVPAELAAVVKKATSFEPSSRYASAFELVKAVRSAVGMDVPHHEATLGEHTPDENEVGRQRSAAADLVSTLSSVGVARASLDTAADVEGARVGWDGGTGQNGEPGRDGWSGRDGGVDWGSGTSPDGEAHRGASLGAQAAPPASSTVQMRTATLDGAGGVHASPAQGYMGETSRRLPRFLRIILMIAAGATTFLFAIVAIWLCAQYLNMLMTGTADAASAVGSCVLTILSAELIVVPAAMVYVLCRGASPTRPKGSALKTVLRFLVMEIGVFVLAFICVGVMMSTGGTYLDTQALR